VDEAGRGCLAGPLVAAAVVLDPARPVPGLKDSKLLSPGARERLGGRILESAIAVGASVIGSREVDELNVRQAAQRAMKEALDRLEPAPDFVLVDGLPIEGLPWPNRSIVHGDRISASVAAASIVAKVLRDRIMEAYEEIYPGFGFSRNKGYGTREHMQALEAKGPTPIHRRSFRPVREAALPFEETLR
jgi:ribonuclease HII